LLVLSTSRRCLEMDQAAHHVGIPWGLSDGLAGIRAWGALGWKSLLLLLLLLVGQDHGSRLGLGMAWNVHGMEIAGDGSELSSQIGNDGHVTVVCSLASYKVASSSGDLESCDA
jgi:hypothetical protein